MILLSVIEFSVLDNVKYRGIYVEFNTVDIAP